jgi:hypothetical protein
MLRPLEWSPGKALAGSGDSVEFYTSVASISRFFAISSQEMYL